MNLLGFLLLFSPSILSPYNSIMGYNVEEIYIFKQDSSSFTDKICKFAEFIIILSLVNAIVLFFIARKLYGDSDSDRYARGDSYSDSDADSDSDGDGDGEDIIYESQYFDKLEEMPDKELSPEEKNDISSRWLTEETPKGFVIMSYNVTTETFEYYTDKFSDISYEILDTVARLFTVTFNCKQICVNYRKEIEEGQNRMLSEIEYDNMMKEREAENSEVKDKERSVFAKFKTYNKKTGNNVAKKYYIITEKANKFKYKGKIADYEKLTKKDSEDEVNKNVKNISYAEFKQLKEDLQQKEELQQKEDLQLKEDLQQKADLLQKEDLQLKEEYIHVEETIKLKED